MYSAVFVIRTGGEAAMREVLLIVDAKKARKKCSRRGDTRQDLLIDFLKWKSFKGYG